MKDISFVKNKKIQSLNHARIESIDRIKGRVSLSMRNGLISTGTYLYNLNELREGMTVLVGKLDGSYVIIEKVTANPKLSGSLSMIKPVQRNQLLILNFEGEDEATTWTEEAQSLVPSAVDSFVLDTSHKKFGLSSLAPVYDEYGSLLYDLSEVYSGDFTWHGWVRYEKGTGGNSFVTYIRIYNDTAPPTNSQINVEPYCDDGVVYYNVYIANEYSNPVIDNASLTPPNQNDGEHHIAVIGKDNNLYFAIDGIIQGTYVLTHPIFIQTFCLEGYADPSLSAALNFDAWELVNYAKWTANFIPPIHAPRKGVDTV